MKLIESLIIIAILGLLMTISVTGVRGILRAIHRITATHHAYFFLHHAKQAAQAHQVDTVIHVDPTNSLSYTHPFYATLTQPLPTMIATISGRHQIGFTKHGRTKYAGTLTLSQPPHYRQLSLSIGHGQIRIKP